MQQYSTTGGCSQGTLDFLHQLVQRHLESVLAANGLESLPENTFSGQSSEAPGGGGDDVQLEEPAGSKGDEGSLSAVLAAPQPESPSEKKQMGEEGQALVLQCEERVKALAWKFARVSSRVDVEEFVSIGMLAVCEVVARRETLCMRDPMGYLYTIARHAMGDEWRRIQECSTASLDAPLSDSGSLTLHDLLPSLAVTTASPVSKRERAVHGALERVSSVRQRAVLQWRYGLSEYKASLKETAGALGTTVKAVDRLRSRGLHNLARDAVLCEVMGVEVH